MDRCWSARCVRMDSEISHKETCEQIIPKEKILPRQDLFFIRTTPAFHCLQLFLQPEEVIPPVKFLSDPFHLCHQGISLLQVILVAVMREVFVLLFAITHSGQQVHDSLIAQSAFQFPVQQGSRALPAAFMVDIDRCCCRLLIRFPRTVSARICVSDHFSLSLTDQIGILCLDFTDPLPEFAD